MLGTTRTAVMLVCSVPAGYFLRSSHSKSHKAGLYVGLWLKEKQPATFFLPFGRKVTDWCLCADDMLKQEKTQWLTALRIARGCWDEAIFRPILESL